MICFVNDVLHINISINGKDKNFEVCRTRKWGVCGSDKKMRSMWLGRENEEYVARTRKWGVYGSDEKMRSMWLGRENEEYVARTSNFCCWPASPVVALYEQTDEHICTKIFIILWKREDDCWSQVVILNCPRNKKLRSCVLRSVQCTHYTKPLLTWWVDFYFVTASSYTILGSHCRCISDYTVVSRNVWNAFCLRFFNSKFVLKILYLIFVMIDKWSYMLNLLFAIKSNMS